MQNYRAVIPVSGQANSDRYLIQVRVGLFLLFFSNLLLSCSKDNGESKLQDSTIWSRTSSKKTEHQLLQWAYISHSYSSAKIRRISQKNILNKYDTVSLSGYHLYANGTIKSATQSKKTRSLLNSQGIQVTPLISFASVSHGKKLLKSRQRWANAYESILGLARDSSIHLDFEYLPARYLRTYINFLSGLRIEIEKREQQRKKIILTLFPPLDFPEKYNAFHNPAKLAKLADEFVLMAYDKHQPGRSIGPVSDIHWIKKNIEYVTRWIKPQKIWLGLPAYGYRWYRNGKAKTVPVYAINNCINLYKSSRAENGLLKIHAPNLPFYLPDYIFFKAAESLAQDYTLRGIAIWQIGFLYP